MTSIDSIDGHAWPDAKPPIEGLRLSRRLRRTAWNLGKIAALVVLLGAGLVVANEIVSKRPMPPPAPHPLAETWVAIRRPIPVYALTGTDFAKLPLDYEASRHSTGGGRNDILTFGDTLGVKPWLRLSLYRVGNEAVPPGTLAQDLADLAPGADLEGSDAAAPSVLQTRFGPIEAADMRIDAASGAASCLGFRSAPDKGAPLRIAGLACGTLERPVGRDLLGCVIDRIDLLSAGDDEALRDLFVAAERRRGPACQPSPLTAAGSRTTWLDANSAVPTLKHLPVLPTRQW